MIRTFVFLTLPSLVCLTANSVSALDGGLIFPLHDKHSHSSSIVECPNGDLLACWYHGSGERRADDVQVQGARSRDGGKTWSPVFQMVDSPNLPDCNPILFIDAKERLWLIWQQVLANRWEHGLLKYRRAEEYTADGPPKWTWQDVIVLKPGDSLPQQIKEGFKAIGFEQGYWSEYARAYDDTLAEAAQDPAKRQRGWMPRNHVTVLPGGRILLPLYSDGFNISLAAISDDLGETWQASGAMIGLGPIQPSIVRCDDGTLHAYFRDAGGPPKRVLKSTSDDDGTTWSPATDTEILNPGGSMEVIRLADGDWVMIYNDTEQGRHSLAVALSTDEGKTWGAPKHLDRDESKRSSFGYPSIIEAANGKIHATYTYSKPAPGHRAESIKHVAFDKSWLAGK